MDAHGKRDGAGCQLQPERETDAPAVSSGGFSASRPPGGSAALAGDSTDERQPAAAQTAVRPRHAQLGLTGPWRLHRTATGLVAGCCLGLLGLAVAADPSPPPSITLPCTVVEVTDGDTVVVQVTLQASVRLKDCWARELRDGGQPAKQRLTELAKGKDGTLSVDLTDAKRLGDVFTFGRVVGTLWIDGTCVNRRMVEEEYATETRQ